MRLNQPDRSRILGDLMVTGQQGVALDLGLGNEYSVEDAREVRLDLVDVDGLRHVYQPTGGYGVDRHGWLQRPHSRGHSGPDWQLAAC